MNSALMIKMKLKERAKKLNEDIPAIFLALKDKKTPWYAKALAAITVAYALSPIDLIPDFIPVLGYLDDLLLLPAMTALTIKLIPSDVLSRCRERAGEMWKDGKPKRWYYALPIVLFWAIVLFVVIKAVFFSRG